MRHVHIAIGLIQQGDKYLLQLRDGGPEIGGAGLIGCFGGKIDKGEEPLASFCREILEEMALSPKPHEVKHLGMVRVKSDHQLELVKVTGHVFHWELKTDKKPRIKEGKLIIMTKTEALSSLDKMTTGTRAVFEKLV